MSKRRLGGALWLTLAAGLAVTACNTRQTDPVDSGVTSIYELKMALADALKGQEIEVTQSLDLTASPIAILQDVTLRVPQGVTLTTKRQDGGEQTAGIYVAPDATLTLQGGGALHGDNRIVDVDGTLRVRGVDFRTTTKTRGSAITVNAGGRLDFEEGNVDAAFAALWIEGEANLKGGSFVSTSSAADPDVTGEKAWSYTIRIEGQNPAVTVDDDVYVEGVQGCIAMEPYGGSCVINGGTFVSRPRFTESDNFCALALIGGECTVNGGRFYTENQKCLWVAVDDEYKELYLRGGEFSDKGFYGVYLPDGTAYTQDDVVPDEGYAWVERKGSARGYDLHYAVIPE